MFGANFSGQKLRPPCFWQRRGQRRGRRSARAAFAAVAALLAACAPATRPGRPPQHLLLVTVEHLRADHLGAYGYPRTTSSGAFSGAGAPGRPASIDELAATGVLFERAYTPAGERDAAIRALLGGGVGAPALGERLQAAGFRCGAFLSRSDPTVELPPELARGFETVFSGPASGTPASQAPDPDLDAVRAAIQWLGAREATDERPLFTWLHFSGTALPFAPGALRGVEFAERFADPDYAGGADGRIEFLAPSGGEPPALDGLDLEQIVALYDGEIARTDFLLGLFLEQYRAATRADERDAADPLDETLVVFAGLFGAELFGHQQYWGHAKSPWSTVLRVPLFVRHPPSLTGSRVLTPVVELSDVAPTVLEWFGAEPAATAQELGGRSLLALTDTYVARPFEPRAAVGRVDPSSPTPIATLCDGAYRLVWNPGGAQPRGPLAGVVRIPELALYDLSRDPLELVDVSAERPEVAQALLGELQARLGVAPEADSRGDG